MTSGRRPEAHWKPDFATESEPWPRYSQLPLLQFAENGPELPVRRAWSRGKSRRRTAKASGLRDAANPGELPCCGRRSLPLSLGCNCRGTRSEPQLAGGRLAMKTIHTFLIADSGQRVKKDASHQNHTCEERRI